MASQRAARSSVKIADELMLAKASVGSVTRYALAYSATTARAYIGMCDKNPRVACAAQHCKALGHGSATPAALQPRANKPLSHPHTHTRAGKYAKGEADSPPLLL